VPYNISPEAVERWRTVLDSLLTGDEVRIKTNDPQTLAYRIREALASARALEIEPYASISYKFRSGPGYVLAKPRTELMAEIVAIVPTAPMRDHVFTEAKTVFDVLNIVRDNPELDQLHFPSFTGDTDPLRKWAAAKRYSITDQPVLVLTREDGDTDAG
jgi:hypothetical protein